MDNRLGTYRRIDTMGKSPLDLILKVYDGAIAAYDSARECYKNEDFQGGYDQLERARRFVTHLYTTLDLEKGGEIAENLVKLYAFLISQTDLAIATKDITVLTSNVKMLRNLREAWAGIKDNSPDDRSEPDRGTEPEKQGGEFTVSG